MHLANSATLDVEAMHADGTVASTCDGVLVVVGAWILRIFRLFRAHAFVPREAEHRHFRFVVSNPGNHRIVGIKVESTGKRELLFVHPIRLAVDNLVELAVLCDLALAIVEQEFDEEEELTKAQEEEQKQEDA